MTNSRVTKEYLESFLKEPVERFEVKPGSNLGDGYTCAMISVDVWKKNSSPASAPPLSLIIKCYPENPSRQEVLDFGNTFLIELTMYDTIAPKLVEFQKGILTEDKIVKPPFPGFLHGNYIPPAERKKLSEPMKPLDNCIVMLNLRAPSNGAFRLWDRFLGLDLDHYRLVIEAQAKLHALSMAYKCRNNNVDLEEEFPVLKQDFATLIKLWEPMMLSNVAISKNYMKGNSKAIGGIEHFEKIFKSVVGLYFDFEYGQTASSHTKDSVLKTPGPSVDNEEAWEVLLQGDSWSNNMMFRYDEKTGRPVEVLLLDLQVSKQGDPFWDVTYTLYASASPSVRRKHLESMLHIYYDTFEAICGKLGVPLLPGWSWTELNRRFHRAKVMGAMFSLSLLPIMLKNQDEVTNLDKAASDVEKQSPSKNNMESASEFFANLAVTDSDNPILVARLGAVLEELVDSGVL